MGNSPPSAGWFSTLRSGQQYLNTWPAEKRLAVIFPEYRICRATRFGLHFMPPVAVFVLCWQILFHAQTGPAIATALFAVSLPLQGLWWLGKRAVRPLPPGLLQWYHQLRETLESSGKTTVSPAGQITYLSLAELLNSAFNQLDKSFLDDL